jgi:hypothetical protein
MTRRRSRIFLPGAAPTLGLAAGLLLLAGCGPSEGESAAESAATEALAPQDAYWANLQALCESAAPGELLQAPDDQISPDAALVVHFWECGEEEIRFPLHVDDNRSRTWVFIRHDDGLELRHDHRYEDGTEESNTWYGAHTQEEGTANRQDFVTVRGEMTSGWRVEIHPGESYVYGTARNGEFRHHLVFDLTNPVEIPPPHWGHETRPSQRPTPSGD